MPQSRRIPLTIPSSPPLTRIDAVLSERLSGDYPLTALPRLNRSLRADAAMFWSERAWSEYSALPLISQVLLEGIKSCAPLNETAGAAAILQDEALHTRLARDVAESFGGYLDLVPTHLDYDPIGLAGSRYTLAEWLIAGGCVGETLSRALIQARLRYTAPPQLHAIVQRTLRDENVHVAYAWAAFARAVAPLSKIEKRCLLEVSAPTVDAAFRGLATEGITGKPGAAERRLRQRVADAGLGCCPPDEETRVVRATLETVIVPGLRRAGFQM